VAALTLNGLKGARPDAPCGQRTGPLLADAVVLVLFVAVPLAASPRLWDQFTTAKWYLLEALAAFWFLIELWRCGSCGWPTFVRQRRLVVLGLAGLVVLNCFRAGVAWAVPALLDRLGFVLLVLAAYWYFRRNGGWMGSIVLGVGLSLSLVVAVGLAQVLGWQALPFLSGGDQRSAFFGNVNMTAQFVGLAVIFLLAGCPSASHVRVRKTLTAAGFVYLYFLSCRSVYLALAGALAFLVATRRLSVGSLLRMLGTATVGVLILLYLGPLLGEETALRGPLSTEVLAHKATSTEWRLAVWKSTLSLIRNHPLGVGSGNFGDAFIPYQLGLEGIPGESVLFRTPHNEYLRTLAEEGLVVGVVVAVLLLSLLRRLHVSPRVGRWRSEHGALLGAGLVFLLMEAFFQFPLGTAFGGLATAVLLGLGVAILEPSPGEEGTRAGEGCLVRWRVVGTLVAAIAVIGLGRVATSEYLFVNRRDDLAAQETACRLNPRNLPACVTAAWLRARAGDRRQARTLLVQVLQRSPYYHPAIRLLGEEAAAHGDPQEACRYLWVYDQLFRERSAVHARLGRLCGDEPPAGLPAGFSVPYYRELPLTARDAALR
jgi:O-antigen ligase